MKVLVTGAKGQLGYDVVKALANRDVPRKGVDTDDFDITDKDAVFHAITDYAPTVVIHCAAYIAVDRAEDEPERCRKVNENGARYIAEACKSIDATMIYISTDYVFPGHGDHFHNTDDPTSPVSVYGKTKLAGEKAVQETLDKFFIVRTSWVFGENGNNFVKTMLRLSKECESLDVVCDQIGSPTYTADLAPLLCDMAESDKYGVYHATNEGICSWAEFAQAVFMQVGLKTTVVPISTGDYPAKAVRPLNSRLDKCSLEANGFKRLPHWEDALFRYLTIIGEVQH